MKNMLKMALLDPNCSLLKVNFGRLFTGRKFAFLKLLKVAQSAKNRPIWSP
jgi:hypothetical protein